MAGRRPDHLGLFSAYRDERQNQRDQYTDQPDQQAKRGARRLARNGGRVGQCASPFVGIRAD
jgi:hypothetical protein